MRLDPASKRCLCCSCCHLLQGSECRAESFVDFHINALAVWLRILRRCGGDAGWLQPGRLFLRSGFARFFCCDSLSNQLPPMRHSALKAVNQFSDAEMRMVGKPGSAGNDSGGIFDRRARPEEHTSELQSLMRISYAVFCLKKKNVSMSTQLYIQ